MQQRKAYIDTNTISVEQISRREHQRVEVVRSAAFACLRAQHDRNKIDNNASLCFHCQSLGWRTKHQQVIELDRRFGRLFDEHGEQIDLLLGQPLLQQRTCNERMSDTE